MSIHKSRSEFSEDTFEEARLLANANGMRLTNPAEGCYQLRHLERGWIINMYPRRGGANPRMYHDPHHKGPFLKLPDHWTILDAVRAAIAAETTKPPEAPCELSNSDQPT